MRFQFTVDLTTMLPCDETTTKPVETFTGTIEAESYDDAEQKAWTPIVERKKQIEREQGIMVGVGPVHLAVTREPQTPELAEIRARIAALPEDQRIAASKWTGNIEDRDAFYYFLGKIAALDRMMEDFKRI